MTRTPGPQFSHEPGVKELAVAYTEDDVELTLHKQAIHLHGPDGLLTLWLSPAQADALRRQARR